MLCPNCRTETLGVDGRCTSCGKPLVQRDALRAITPLTPPSDSARRGAEDLTRLEIPGAEPQPLSGEADELTQHARTSSSGTRNTGATRILGTTSPLETGQAFGRYHVIRVLGVGGMGAVYQAWDDELGVAVALKVIRPELTPETAAGVDIERRFKRELLLARQVTHKNVVRIHDLGEIDGIKYITMPYIQGRDLAAVLRETGRLPVAKALAIARQVVAGLEAAHEVGVVHRDLKPANIMIEDDRALIMDFGIARSISGDAATIGTGATKSGAVIGTLEFMAPEQARGEVVDHRADIYAFGLIFYDMLVGRRSSAGGDSAVADLMRRMQSAPPSPRAIDPAIPEAIDSIVVRCLQPDPAARFQTTSELGAELNALDADGHRILSPLRGTTSRSSVLSPATGDVMRRPILQLVRNRRAIAAALFVLLVAAGAFVARDRLISGNAGDNSAVSSPAISLAILPFRNASGDSTLDWLGSSLAEMLRTELGQSSHLQTVPPDRVRGVLRDLHVSSDSTFDPATLRRLAEFTNAETVLWGQYLRFGNEIRIDAALEDLRRQRSVPLKVASPNQSGLLTAIGQLAQEVRENLALSPDVIKQLQERAFRPSSQSLEALRNYHDGLQLARQGKHSEALKAFRASTTADSEFALAYSKLGQTYANLGYDTQAEQASRRAVELSERLPEQERYLIVAGHARILNDNARAIESYENLAKVSPDDPEVQFNLGALHEASGSFDRAREYYRQVLARDPNYIEALFAAGRIEIQKRNPQGSLEYLNRALTLAIQEENDEAKANVLNAIGVAYKRLNKADEALRYYQQSLEIKQRRNDKRGIALTLGEIASVNNSLGKPDEALTNYTEALRLHREIGNKKGIGITLINLGAFNRDRARYDDALRLFKEALQIEREIGDKNYQALCLDNIGGIYTFQGEFDDARTYFERALELREELKVPGNIADTLHNLAETSTRIGSFDEALKQYLRALELRRGAGDKRGASIESYSLGTVFEQQGRYGAAVKSKEEALKGFRELQDRSFWLGEILSGYGHALGQSGRNAEAETVLKEALDVAREIRSQGLIAQTLNFLGDNAAYRGDGKAARSLFEQALKEAARTGDQHLVLLSTANVARAVMLEKRLSANSSSLFLSRRSGSRTADANVRKAIESLGEVGREADRLGFKYLSLECSIDRAEALLHAGDFAQARQELERATAQSEKLGLRMLRAKAEYLVATERRLAGNETEAARHASEARRLLNEIAKEAQSDLFLKRADLVTILQDPPSSGGNPQSKN
jgi:tetratricopeptide (TPR) repeat protein/serine/threonine protein kinase